jgi:hypothetical protein
MNLMTEVRPEPAPVFSPLALVVLTPRPRAAVQFSDHSAEPSAAIDAGGGQRLSKTRQLCSMLALIAR